MERYCPHCEETTLQYSVEHNCFYCIECEFVVPAKLPRVHKPSLVRRQKAVALVK